MITPSVMGSTPALVVSGRNSGVNRMIWAIESMNVPVMTITIVTTSNSISG